MIDKLKHLIHRYPGHSTQSKRGKPSLSEYYAGYLFRKPVKDLTQDEIYQAERILIPLVLKYYLDLSLTWKERVDLILNELEEFYLYYCKRKKRWSFKDSKKPRDEGLKLDNQLKFLKGKYTLRDVLQWCGSTVPRSRFAFTKLLSKTQGRDIEKLLDDGAVTRERLMKIYTRRKSKLVPAVRYAIKIVLNVETAPFPKSKKKRRVYRLNKRGLGNSVFFAYLKISKIKPSNYIEEQNIRYQFKLKFARIWFTAKNRRERERWLDKTFPGLLEVVSYTTLWYFIREQIDEYLLSEALSREEIKEYLNANKHRLGSKMRDKLLRAYYLSKR